MQTLLDSASFFDIVSEWERSAHETDCSYLAGYYYVPPARKGDDRIGVWFHDNTDHYVIYDSIREMELDLDRLCPTRNGPRISW